MAQWSEAEYNMLRAAWDEGKSASAIGKEMGRTRNAIIGAKHRLRLAPRNVGRASGQSDTPKEPRPNPRRYVRFRPLPPVNGMGNTAPPPESKGIGFLDLKWQDCKAVIGKADDARGLAIYCGAPKAVGSFCLYHHQLYHIPPRR